MDIYFNTSMDSTYVGKYSTLVCFRPIVVLCNILHNICEIIGSILTLVPTNNQPTNFYITLQNKQLVTYFMFT
jgi:hypothetical protein